MLLLAAAFFIGSCLRSTLITSNDLGWRAWWLPGQFILLMGRGCTYISGVYSPTCCFAGRRGKGKLKSIINIFFDWSVDISDGCAVLLRTAWPVMTGADVTRKYYSARLAYDYLRDYIPANVVTQNNPLNFIDRPSGLYGTHQMVISDCTSYGVPIDIFNDLSGEVGKLFAAKNMTDWKAVDQICQEYLINVLIIEDLDLIWDSVPLLTMQRPPLYKNTHYAIFTCGKYDMSILS